MYTIFSVAANILVGTSCDLFESKLHEAASAWKIYADKAKEVTTTSKGVSARIFCCDRNKNYAWRIKDSCFASLIKMKHLQIRCFSCNIIHIFSFAVPICSHKSFASFIRYSSVKLFLLTFKCSTFWVGLKLIFQ